MPGKVLKINVAVGDKVTRGQTVLVLEAMKMQNDIGSPADGTVTAVRVTANQSVNAGEDMIVLG
jgi:biotin carboxyl carrier protein